MTVTHTHIHKSRTFHWKWTFSRLVFSPLGFWTTKTLSFFLFRCRHKFRNFMSERAKGRKERKERDTEEHRESVRMWSTHTDVFFQPQMRFNELLTWENREKKEKWIFKTTIIIYRVHYLRVFLLWISQNKSSLGSWQRTTDLLPGIETHCARAV